ncbi:MAG: RelA/SpoT AH/RIS domain-containing protein, partial [Paracoccaceae bacterium]
LVGRIEKGDEPLEFLEHAKLEMFSDQVFCFTPNGEVVGLPRGATPIDFAYTIHTKVGNHCAGALVDGRRVPLWTRLRNGQQVEIVTAQGQSPSPHWEDIAQTGRAKAAIRRAMRGRLRNEQVALGRDLLTQALARDGREAGDKTFQVAAERLNQPSVDELLASVALGRLTAAQVVGSIYPAQPDGAAPAPVPSEAARVRGHGIRRSQAIRFCTCCWPLPGDRIMGVARRGGLIVHAVFCPMLEEVEDELERWHDLVWHDDAAQTSMNVSRLSLTLANEPGALGRVCTLVGEQQANIDNIAMTTRKPDFFQMNVDLEVRDTKHLSGILSALKAQSFVNHIERAIETPPDRSKSDPPAQRPLPLGEGVLPSH